MDEGSYLSGRSFLWFENNSERKQGVIATREVGTLL